MIGNCNFVKIVIPGKNGEFIDTIHGDPLKICDRVLLKF